VTQTVLLGDIADINPESVGKAYSHTEILYLDTSSVTENTFSELQTFSLRDAPSRAKRIIRDGDVVYSTVRPNLKHFGYIHHPVENTVASTGFAVIRAKENVDPKYLYYWLASGERTEYLTAIADSQTSTFPAFNPSILSKLKIELPDLEAQKKIADILGTIDEKIELNRKVNETLEQMGQALFRHYFVDNPEAEKWKHGTVSDFASHSKISVNPAKSPDTQFSQYSIPAFDNSMSPEATMGAGIKSNKYGVVDWSILVSKLNPATPRIWPVSVAHKNAVCSTEFQVIVPDKYYSFAYFLLTSREYSDKMAMMTSGTSNSHHRISPADILNYSFNKPDSSLIDEFEAKTKDYIVMVDQNRQQIQTLTTLRDTLLPRLINGKVIL
jgi:type I restriction enzyme S subunit